MKEAEVIQLAPAIKPQPKRLKTVLTGVGVTTVFAVYGVLRYKNYKFVRPIRLDGEDSVYVQTIFGSIYEAVFDD